MAAEAAEAALQSAKPLKMNSYKVDLSKTLVRRALLSLAGEKKRQTIRFRRLERLNVWNMEPVKEDRLELMNAAKICANGLTT